MKYEFVKKVEICLDADVSSERHKWMVAVINKLVWYIIFEGSDYSYTKSTYW